jgi:drug/metabolite transporter (DMT)-like permease
MSRIYVPYIAALALLWGASYMFIKVADRAFEPTSMILLRLVIASAIVFVALVAQRGLSPAIADLRRLGWQGFGLGVVNAAIPFTLIAWG